MKHNPIQIFEPSQNLQKRHKNSKIWRTIFFLSTVLAILILVVLVLSIVNQAFGLVVVKNTVDPVKLSPVPLEQLGKSELIKILKANLTSNRYKTINRELPFTARSENELVGLVNAEIVKPAVMKSYHLDVSIFEKEKSSLKPLKNSPVHGLNFAPGST